MILTSGVSMAMDLVLPIIFADLTSGTIFYEDIADDGQGRSDLNAQLLDIFIERNVMNGVLGSEPYDPPKENAMDENGNLTRPVYDKEYMAKIKKYQNEGYANSEVRALLARDGEYSQFASINLDGYESFVGPYLDMANDKRMTVPIVVALVIGERDSVVSSGEKGTSGYGSVKRVDGLKATEPYATGAHDFYVFDKTANDGEGGLVAKKVRWTIIDMMGDVLLTGDINTINGTKKFALGLPIDISGIGDISSLIGMVLPMLNPTLETISEIVENEAVAGDTLRLSLTVEGTNLNLGLVANNADRGMLDYQSQAWLDANGLLYIICSIFVLRKVCYIFAGVTMVLTLVIGYLREIAAGDQVDSENNADYDDSEEQPDYNTAYEAPASLEFEE
jgi:hypothetical protein